MGLDVNGIRFILLAKRLGVDFRQALTIGRQGLHLTPAQLRRELSLFNFQYPEDFPRGSNAYCEPLLTLLGAEAAQSLDNSDYEHATMVHDMNQSLPEQLKGTFSVVIDAGTLEHVFNFPVAIKNCMELLQTGGFFLSIMPANNFMGHGFYQFSPELFFSVFTSKNGFELVKLIICETYEGAQWYEVSKPKGGVQGRVTLVNHNPTYLMCMARRLDARCEPLVAMPQQSDYLDLWTDQTVEGVTRAQSPSVGTIRTLLKSVPGVGVLARSIRYLRKPAFCKRDFTPYDVFG